VSKCRGGGGDEGMGRVRMRARERLFFFAPRHAHKKGWEGPLAVDSQVERPEEDGEGGRVGRDGVEGADEGPHEQAHNGHERHGGDKAERGAEAGEGAGGVAQQHEQPARVEREEAGQDDGGGQEACLVLVLVKESEGGVGEGGAL